MSSASISLEWIDPNVLGLDPDAPAATELMAWCATALAILSLDASKVRIVITGDFVESVKQRLPSEELQRSYNLDRNGGQVGAKTMLLPDGSHDVLMHAAHFAVELMSEEQRASNEQFVKRTVVHEAHHVVMAQAGEVGGSFDGEAWARRNFLTIADQVIEEFRAEAAIGPSLQANDDDWDCIDILMTLSADLWRIVMEYQTHVDVPRLSYEIGMETHTAWKLLAYVAARRLHDDGEFEPLPVATTTHPVWERMVGPHWEPFLDILAVIPPGSQRIEREQLDEYIADLASEFADWLEHIGFAFVDYEDGQTSFRIIRWDLP